MIKAILEVWASEDLTLQTLKHLQMFSIALFIAATAGVLIGLFIYSRPRFAEATLNIFNVVETIPDMALLIILLPLLSLGAGPTIAASVLYSILPISRNTYTGLANVNREYLDVAEAMGMSAREILFNVRILLALPLIAGGVRIALVFTMGVVTLGGLEGAEGLGAPLQTGIFNSRPDIIIVAGLWVGVLAVVFDGIAGLLEEKLKGSYERC
jgi:osmoprotectant transport system permease protein